MTRLSFISYSRKRPNKGEIMAERTPYEAMSRELRHRQYSIDVAERDMVICIGAWRHTGATWTEIGRALKITRQAARQRFATTVALLSGKGNDDEA